MRDAIIKRLDNKPERLFKDIDIGTFFKNKNEECICIKTGPVSFIGINDVWEDKWSPDLECWRVCPIDVIIEYSYLVQ